MIVTHASEAAYKAAEKSEIESTVGLIESSNRVVIDGVNVVTDNPGIGDILCIDENRKYRFIQLDTFHAGTFPAAWETLGVVVLRKGNTVTVCSKHHESKKFMEVFPYIVTGQVLDGEEHTAQLKLHGSESFEFKYTANTDEEFVEALKSFLTEHGFSDWSAYIMDGKIILQYDNYTSAEYLYPTITQVTGLTLTGKVTLDTPAPQKYYLKCGIQSLGLWHAERAKVFLRNDTNITSYNPATDIDSMPIFTVCWPAFCGTSQYQSDHCLWLRQRYCADPDNPKIEEWERYIEDYTIVLPYMTGGASPEWRHARFFSDDIKDITYIATDGKRKLLYPAANYCSKFFDGKGYIPSVPQLVESFDGVTYGLDSVTRGKADAINRSLYAIGGDAVSCRLSYFVSIRYSNMHVLFASSNGDFGGTGYYGVPKALPFADIDLSEITD